MVYMRLAVAAKYFQDPDRYITDLDISDNRIGAVGARVLGEAFAQSGGLKRLAVRGNAMGEEGCHDIAAIIAKNTALTRLEYVTDPRA